jgi:hypothetical protein
MDRWRSSLFSSAVPPEIFHKLELRETIAFDRLSSYKNDFVQGRVS